MLNVVYGAESVTVQPASSENAVENGWDIRYGQPEKGAERAAGAVYLDSGRNNIEIVLSEKGSFERRL